MDRARTAAMVDKPKPLSVKVYCGCYIGEVQLFDEQKECMYEDEITVDIQEWDDGDCMIICPSCGAKLWQCDDHMEAIDDIG